MAREQDLNHFISYAFDPQIPILLAITPITQCAISSMKRTRAQTRSNPNRQKACFQEVLALCDQALGHAAGTKLTIIQASLAKGNREKRNEIQLIFTAALQTIMMSHIWYRHFEEKHGYDKNMFISEFGELVLPFIKNPTVDETRNGIGRTHTLSLLGNMIKLAYGEDKPHDTVLMFIKNEIYAPFDSALPPSDFIKTPKESALVFALR